MKAADWMWTFLLAASVAVAATFMVTELGAINFTDGLTENRSFSENYMGPDQWPAFSTVNNVEIGDRIRQANLNSKGIIITENISLTGRGRVQNYTVRTYYEGADDNVNTDFRIWNRTGALVFNEKQDMANGTNTFTVPNVTGTAVQYKFKLTSGGEIQ